MSHNPIGSLWNRWDLHFHTPSSSDYQHMAATNQDLVDGLIEEGVRVVAVTDHHTIDVERIREMQRLGRGRLTVLPGIELRCELGGKEQVHFIGVFPENGDIESIWQNLQVRLNLTPKRIQQDGEETIWCKLEEASRIIREHGGLVTIHGHAKSNSIEGIGNAPKYKAVQKAAVLSDQVDILEVGHEERLADYEETVFPAIGFRLPIVACSDNHDIRSYKPRSKCWIKADPTFTGLLMAVREPLERVHIGEEPRSHKLLRERPTMYGKSVSFVREATCPVGHKWFSGSIPLNPGLIAIIGNKGSGKSALADTIGLVGASRNTRHFSFLTDGRFRHRSLGPAAHFTAMLQWHAGPPSTRRLSENPGDTIPERVKYLPQQHVENVCSEISTEDDSEFARELKGVIFSHVPDEQRLEQHTLDDLLNFRSSEHERRIDGCIKALRPLSRERATLEAKAAPRHRQGLEQSLAKKKEERDALQAGRPTPVENPAEEQEAPEEESGPIAQLGTLEKERDRLKGEIADAQAKLKAAERRHAVARRVVQRLDGFDKEVIQLKEDLREDAEEIGLVVTELVQVQIDNARAEQVRDAASGEIESLRAQLVSDDPPGLQGQLDQAIASIESIQNELDAPRRAYQAYLKEQADWNERMTALQGTKDDPDSLAGIEHQLSLLEGIPAKITACRAKQLDLAKQVLAEKLAQRAIYQELYGPVQTFIDEHPVARDRRKLDFRADLAQSGFSGALLNMIAQNRAGSFRGIDDGETRLTEWLSDVNWSDETSVADFLMKVDHALHHDIDAKGQPRVELPGQLRKNISAESVYDYLYSLSFLEPRYILRWDDRDLSMLSPGQRGILLLIFYLLIDKSSVPLIIDQPEGNLDNQTVFEVLVECIKWARRERQVIVVTHNPNLAVVCDADQVIHASINKEDGNSITYKSGALENPETTRQVADVLEGTVAAFGSRGRKYAATIDDLRAMLDSKPRTDLSSSG